LSSVKIMNPHDSQGNQICDSRGDAYPTLRACGGAGYQSGYVFAPMTSYGFDPTASRDVGILFLKEISKTLSNGTCPSHKNGVVIVYER